MSKSIKFTNINENTITQKSVRYFNHHSTSLKVYDSKEFENLDIDKIRSEKEKNMTKLEKETKELEQMKNDFLKYNDKTKERENELRSHILNLSNKIRKKDIDVVNESIKDLHSQIITNIADIQVKVRLEITEKKKDIENRINMRLMDSEYKHQLILDEKVKEHESVLKSYHKYTEEMIKIKSNYDNIKDKCNKFEKENDELKKNIDELERKNAQYKLDLMNLKKINNIAKDELTLRKQDINEGETVQIIENHSILQNNEKIEKLPNIEQNYNSDDEIEDYVKNLMSDQNFLKNNAIQTSVYTSLVDILENSKLKLNKLKKNHKELTEMKTELQLCVEKIISKLKKQSMNDSFGKPKADYCIYLSKDDRKRFIDNLMNDDEILRIFQNESLPTISIIDRKINKN